MGKQFRIPAELSGGKACVFFEGLVEMNRAVKSTFQGNLQHGKATTAADQSRSPFHTPGGDVIPKGNAVKGLKKMGKVIGT